MSDFLPAAAMRRRELYDAVWKPLGVRDSLRLYLTSPADTSRFFFFDRDRRGFPDRSRRLLELLRPLLERTRAQWTPREAGAGGVLSPREQEIVQWVALGLTNDEIARQLWLSPHTVRTHLEHTYRKLGVRIRTQAVRAALH